MVRRKRDNNDDHMECILGKVVSSNLTGATAPFVQTAAREAFVGNFKPNMRMRPRNSALTALLPWQNFYILVIYHYSVELNYFGNVSQNFQEELQNVSCKTIVDLCTLCNIKLFIQQHVLIVLPRCVSFLYSNSYNC